MPSNSTTSTHSPRPNVHVVTPPGRAILPNPKTATTSAGVRVRLAAAVLSTIDYEPVVRVLSTPQADGGKDCLPCGDFGTTGDTALDQTLRSQVVASTGLTLGYLNQLATFSDRIDSEATDGTDAAAWLTVGYLGLLHTPTTPGQTAKSQPGWASCYTYLPWEDWRNGRPDVISSRILPGLTAWADRGGQEGATTSADERHRRIQICFGNTHAWDDERVLERFELMQTAGMFSQTSAAAGTATQTTDGKAKENGAIDSLGRSMAGDHRKILAAALGRLRAKLRYRPVVFELMAHDFTLFELQRTVEGIIGPHLHKQNFRRLVESMGLVEATGDIKTHTGGRPAKLFKFRPGVVLEQAAPGMRVRLGHV
jgi:hypothetical protein